MVCRHSYCTKIQFQYYCRQFITTLYIYTIHLSRGEKFLPIIHSTIIYIFLIINFASTNVEHTQKILKFTTN
ncbi:hypothetical protein C0J52_18100 [Blattella germanica]|nr:hypothetical protein C0J52_18100 [Blattella germanica]